MTIRPIDLQVLIPKASEVNRVSHTQELQSQIEQQQFAAQFKQAVQNRKKRVLETNEAEGQRVRSDQGSRGRGRRQDAHKEHLASDDEHTKEESTDCLNAVLGSHIDIKT
jgi:hypothetical protein